MTMTRNVVKDLLPIYLLGEASDDTRRLVEEFLATDDALRRDVESARRFSLPSIPDAAPTAEKAALDATRQLLKHRTSTLVLAVLFTLLPFSFVVKHSQVTFVMFRDEPAIAAAWWATAAVLWVWHFLIRRRLRVSGL